MMFVKLRPGIPLIERGNSRLQFGCDPDHAVMIKNLTEAEIEYLLYLSKRPSPSKLIRKQQQMDLSAWRIHQLHKELAEAGLMEEAPQARTHAHGAERTLCARLDGCQNGYLNRSKIRVLLVGADRLGVLIAALLNSAGITDIAIEAGNENKTIGSQDLFPFTQSAIGSPRIQAAADLLRNLSPEANISMYSYYDLAVIITYGSFSPVPIRMLGLNKIPHLAICLKDLSATVGPLVQPGISACTNCLDLYKVDSDPDWPSVKQQLLSWGMHSTPGSADAGSLAMIAGTAVKYITDYIDRRGLYPLGNFTTVPYYPADPVSTNLDRHPNCNYCLS